MTKLTTDLILPKNDNINFVCNRCETASNKKLDSPRRCAFDRNGGVFTSDNWRCATINALLKTIKNQIRWNVSEECGFEMFGWDETMHVLACPAEIGGWLVMTRYKRRGTTSSLMHLGDHEPIIPSLDTINAVLKACHQ